VPPDDPALKFGEGGLLASQRALREARYKRLTGRALPPDEPPLCSFCGAGSNNVRRMLAGFEANGIRAHICDVCVHAFHGADGKKE